MGTKYPRHKQLVWYMRFDGTIYGDEPCGNQSSNLLQFWCVVMNMEF